MIHRRVVSALTGSPAVELNPAAVISSSHAELLSRTILTVSSYNRLNEQIS